MRERGAILWTSNTFLEANRASLPSITFDAMEYKAGKKLDELVDSLFMLPAEVSLDFKMPKDILNTLAKRGIYW